MRELTVSCTAVEKPLVFIFFLFFLIFYSLQIHWEQADNAGPTSAAANRFKEKGVIVFMRETLPESLSLSHTASSTVVTEVCVQPNRSVLKRKGGGKQIHLN